MRACGRIVTRHPTSHLINCVFMPAAHLLLLLILFVIIPLSGARYRYKRQEWNISRLLSQRRTISAICQCTFHRDCQQTLRYLVPSFYPNNCNIQGWSETRGSSGGVKSVNTVFYQPGGRCGPGNWDNTRNDAATAPQPLWKLARLERERENWLQSLLSFNNFGWKICIFLTARDPFCADTESQELMHCAWLNIIFLSRNCILFVEPPARRWCSTFWWEFVL